MEGLLLSLAKMLGRRRASIKYKQRTTRKCNQRTCGPGLCPHYRQQPCGNGAPMGLKWATAPVAYAAVSKLSQAALESLGMVVARVGPCAAEYRIRSIATVTARQRAIKRSA